MRRVSAAASAVAGLAILALTLLCFGAVQSDAAVMGIDFGSEFIKVASVKPGTPFHIVVDEQSKRKVPAVVAFDNGERQFGNNAVQLAMRKPKETYMWAHRLLGKDIHSPEVVAFREQAWPYELVEMPDRRTVGFRHAAAKKEGDKDVIFAVEEVVAMSLQHIMKIAEADAESPVKDCVITVPPYWTHRERQAMLDAAEIAGLNVLGLLNENAAAAIQYGIDRKYNVNETHTVLFYNMGSTSTKVNLAQYTAFVKKERLGKTNKTVGQFEIQGMGYDPTLGGAAFENRLSEFIIGEVNKQLAAKKINYDIRKNPKAIAKIRSAAEKAKVVLSANQESQVFLNSLHEDTDFKFLITREQFYEMCSDLLDRITGPIQQVLDESGVSLEQIDAVAIIGGGVRVPEVQKRIRAFVGKEQLTQSLNGDEAMVMGAVFRAANLSTTFQVRPFGIIDTTPYAVGVRLSDKLSAPGSETAATSTDDETNAKESFTKRASLFKRWNRLQKKKTVQFSHSADFVAALSHEVGSKGLALPAGIPAAIDVYNITGFDKKVINNPKYTHLTTGENAQKPRVALSFLLDASGLSSLVRAEASLEEMVRVPKPKKAAPKVNATTTANANGNDTEIPASEEKKEGETTDNEAEKPAETPAAEGEAAAADATATDAAPAAEGAAKEAGESEPEYEMKKKVHVVVLGLSRVGSPGSIEAMNATHKLVAKAALEKLRRADDLKKEIAAAKNTLEAYIYSTRSSINEPNVEPVSTEDQREAVRSALAAAEDWLYEQGDDSAKVFQDKLAELQALSEPIFFRLAEQTALPAAVEAAEKLIEIVEKQLADYNKTRPWVPEADRKRLRESVDDLKEYLAEKAAAQAKVPAHEKPIFESEDIYQRMRPVHKQSTDLAKLKKPAEKPKPKPKKDAKTNKTAEATGKEGEAGASTEGEPAEGAEKAPETPEQEQQQQEGAETATEGQTEAEQAKTETTEEQQAADEDKKDEL